MATPLQYSCLESAMDRGARQDTVHGVTKSQTPLSTHAVVAEQSYYIKALCNLEPGCFSPISSPGAELHRRLWIICA